MRTTSRTAAAALAATFTKFRRSSDVVPANTPVPTTAPVRNVLDDTTTATAAIAAAAESIRTTSEHSPVDLAQVHAWRELSPSDPICDAVSCIGKASSASLEADLASTGGSSYFAADTSTDGDSFTSIHDGSRLDEGEVASVVSESSFEGGHLVSSLTSEDCDAPKFRSTEIATDHGLTSSAKWHRQRRKNVSMANLSNDDCVNKIDALNAIVVRELGRDIATSGSESFAASGGDSLAAVRLAAKAQEAGIALTAADLLGGRSIQAAFEYAIRRSRATLVWPAARLDMEVVAELASFGIFEDAYPATPLQAGMVAATMQDARAYVNQVALRATRGVSLESLRGALRAVVQHHAILRTSFVSTVAGGIVQIVRASADAAECVAVAAPLAQHLAADKARGFSVADASWIRAALVCDLAGSAQHVVVTIHHALYDGWSLPMIMRDLAAALDGHTLEPRPAFRTVVDFIAAQDAAATEAFWTQQLVGLEPAQPLSLGHSARTDDEDAPLAQACSTPMAELQRAAQRAGVTVAIVLKAAWAATLRKFTRSHDVVFGEVLANRDIAVAGADRIVGPLLNTVPCRVVLDDTVRAVDLVAAVQEQHGVVLSHSHAALVDVQRWAGVQGDGKLFNTL
ncbi:hypothetical protein HK105_209467, partial [Polyrhizophydium stewartii]